MSGVLKTIGKIAAIAAAVVSGPIGWVAAAVAVVATVGSSLLAKKPQSPKNSPESIERLNASIITNTPRKSVIGTTAMATDIRDQEYTESQKYLHRFIVTASHKVNAIREVWFDDKLAWTLAGGVQGEFIGFLTVTPINEGNAGNAINISSRMGATRRFTGLAYVYFRYLINDEKSPFAQGVPTRITIIGDGAALYDPRLDSTVPGGSGSHRANDQSTWTWDDDACRNPALALLWYLLGYKINGELAIGRGMPADRIDLTSFITAANLCDEPVSKSAGGTEPRYRVDGVWSEGDNPQTVLDMLKASMNADLDDAGGKLRLTVFHNDLASPIAAFGPDNILSAVRWDQTPPLDETFNIVRGVYTDPSSNSLYQQVDYPQVEFTSVDGIDRVEPFDVPMVESASQAQRLAKQRLQRQLYGGALNCVLDITAWRVTKNDCVTLTFPPLGWVNKLFRVAEIEFGTDGQCPVLLREENAAIYAWDASDAAPVSPASPTLYSRALDPVLVAIEAAPYAVALGTNTIINSEFKAGLTGFAPGWDGNTGLTPVRALTTDTNWTGVVPTAFAHVTGTPTASTGFDGYINVGDASLPWAQRLKRWALPVFPGDRLYFSIMLGIHRCHGLAICFFYDEDGISIDASAGNLVTNGDKDFYLGNPEKAEVSAAFASVPATLSSAGKPARYAAIVPRAIMTGGTDPYLFFGRYFLAKVAAGQTVPPIYGPGPGDPRADVTAESAIIIAITSDSVFDLTEKRERIITYDALDKNWQALNAKGVALGIAATERAAATAAMNALSAYLSSLSPAWNDVTANTTIVAATFTAKWSDANAAVAALQAAIQGTPGAPGDDGAPGISTSLTVASVQVNTDPGGALKSGEAARIAGKFILNVGGVPTTSGVTFSIPTQSLIPGLSIDSGGNYGSATSVVSFPAQVTVRAVYAGTTYDLPLTVTEARDAIPASGQTSAITALGTAASFVDSGTFDILVPNGLTLYVSANIVYEAAASPGDPYAPRMKITYQNLTDGGAETDFPVGLVDGPEADVSVAAYADIADSYTNSLGASKSFRVKFKSRRSGTTSGLPANVSGTLYGELA